MQFWQMYLPLKSFLQLRLWIYQSLPNIFSCAFIIFSSLPDYLPPFTPILRQLLTYFLPSCIVCTFYTFIHKCNHTMYSFLIWLLLLSNYFETHPWFFCIMSLLSFIVGYIPFYGYTTFWEVFGWFSVTDNYKESCHEHLCTSFWWACAFISID